MKITTSKVIQEMAPRILDIVKDSSKILLHCHPSPDPDSVCSALAMKFALEQLGKEVTLIGGDSDLPMGFRHFPGADKIVAKKFGEIRVEDFDLFLILDSASPEQISRYTAVKFPMPTKTVAIDHHRTNAGYADINLIEPSYPATSEILYQVFEIWKIEIDHHIAANLFMGIYTDTGFKYPGVSSRTFLIAAELLDKAPDLPSIISGMENSRSEKSLQFQALALSSIKTYYDNRIALSLVGHDALVKKGIPSSEVQTSTISSVMKEVHNWTISGALIEAEPNIVRLSFRSHDGEKFDVSRLAAALGGGGHKAAAGAVLKLPLAEAADLVETKIKELYNL